MLMFPDAAGYWGAEDYKITVKSGAKEVFAATVISDYVRADASMMRVQLGALDPGDYSVTVTPCSPYAKTGASLTGTVTLD